MNLPARLMFLFIIGFVLVMNFVLYPACAPNESQDFLKADFEDTKWFRDAKFGLFIHWGPVSLKGTEIGWSRGGERRGRGGKGEIPVEVYDNLYKEFNPVEFDADEWVSIAKDAGMNYLVFTTKHHDGFSMFDTELSEYKITNSPFGRDVTAELAEACHDAGLKLGFYHSPVDWYHPAYRTENHEQYIKFLHGQVCELCTNYGDLDIMWFDGLGGSAEDWNSVPMFKMIRTLQPDILINNRAGLPGDFDTPEQRVGRFQKDRLWESCITICRQWAWKPNDKLKSLEECLDILVRCVGGDGNLLLNVGPMPNGEIEPRQVERLKEIGAWLDQYGESIYETRGGPFKPGTWGASTHKGNTLYLHLFDWEGQDTFVFPRINKKIIFHKVLTGGEAKVTQKEKGIEINMSQNEHAEIDTIIKLELDGSASEIPAVSLDLYNSVASNQEAKASNVYENNNWAYGPAKAFDDDLSTRWATDSGINEAWLSVELKKPVTFNRAVIWEEYKRVQSFELQYKKGDSWETFYKGKEIGDKLSIQFKPITAQSIRLNILKATNGPTIREFQIFYRE